MSFVGGAGVAKMSQLTVDADKDMAGFGLTNLKEIVAGMAVGDMVYFDGTRLQILSPGVLGTELLTRGEGESPFWGVIA